MYFEVAEACFRYFGFTSFEQVDHLTLKEYQTMMKAKRLEWVDADFMQHRQAWLNVQAGAQKEKGQGKSKKLVPVYKNFKDFYDYEEALAEVTGVAQKEGKYEALSRYLKDRDK